MPKEITLNIRMDADERDLLALAAKADDRPVSSLARRVLVAWLRGDDMPDRQAVERELQRRESRKPPP